MGGPISVARADAALAIRAAVEHVFTHQKNRFDLFIRTIGIARAGAKSTLANFDRLIFHKRRKAKDKSVRKGPNRPRI